jgi:6-phosphogluconolactonase
MRVASAVAAAWLLLATTAAALPPSVLLVAGGGAPVVQTYGFDDGVGASTGLLYNSSLASATGWIAVPPTGARPRLPRFVYAIGPAAGGNGTVQALTVDPSSGAMAPAGPAVSSGGAGPAHISVSTNGLFVYTSNYGSGHIAVLPVTPDWTLAPPSQVLFAGAHAHMIVSDASGRFVFVPCLGADYVAQYVVDDPATGLLRPNDPPTAPVAPGAGPRHMAFHPSRARAYVLGELDSTLSVFDYDAGTGRLGLAVATLSTLPSGRTAVGQSAAAVLVPADGGVVYATNRGTGYCGITSFAVDSATGRPVPGAAPSFFAENDPQIFWPRFAALSPDPANRFLLVAGERAGAVVVFARDGAGGGGALRKVAAVLTGAVSGPQWAGVFATYASGGGTAQLA